ncbi:hypothetical protein [Streptomyces sodiiphilus]|uniref:hypothetical protein n=1 Tax=Streptomyces sodiiphilus TaxID=226217 RepID=UPI0031E0411A
MKPRDGPFARRLRATLLGLTRATLRDGREHAVDFDTFTVGVQVRADDGHETYVAVRITGSDEPHHHHPEERSGL